MMNSSRKLRTPRIKRHAAKFATISIQNHNLLWAWRPMQMALMLLLIWAQYTDARIGYFWHITDLHLDTIYSTQGDVLRSCWRIDQQVPNAPTRFPGRFGDYLCDSPWSLIESAAKAMKSRQGDNVEFVLWTGDGLSHSAHPLLLTKKLEILRNITDLLGRTFPSQFVFPVLGHEDGAANFRHMGELWRHWLPSEALHTFEQGGYYSIEQTKSRLRIIALNTNFMRHDTKYSQSHLAAVRQRMSTNSLLDNIPETPEYRNYYYHRGTLYQHHGQSNSGDWTGGAVGYGYNSHGHQGIGNIVNRDSGEINAVGSGGRVSALSEYENQDTEKQWMWLEDVLSKSKNNKETIYIVGHMPPGSDERHIGLQQSGHSTFTEVNNKRYLDLVRKYSSIIQGQFFGHLHSDAFRIIYDEKGKPVSWIMISPSVTPRKMNVGSNNPAMRLYKFDTDSGQVLDYTQYYIDLELANQNGEPNWVPEYNLTHYYALSDISAISLHNFVDRFTSRDVSWFGKYYRANTVRFQTDPCSGLCMLNHYCAITRVDYKEFRQCLEKEQSALRSNSVAMRLTTPSYTLCFAGTALTLLILFCSKPDEIVQKQLLQQQQQQQLRQQEKKQYTKRLVGIIWRIKTVVYEETGSVWCFTCALVLLLLSTIIKLKLLLRKLLHVFSLQSFYAFYQHATTTIITTTTNTNATNTTTTTTITTPLETTNMTTDVINTKINNYNNNKNNNNNNSKNNEHMPLKANLIAVIVKKKKHEEHKLQNEGVEVAQYWHSYLKSPPPPPTTTMTTTITTTVRATKVAMHQYRPFKEQQEQQQQHYQHLPKYNADILLLLLFLNSRPSDSSNNKITTILTTTYKSKSNEPVSTLASTQRLTNTEKDKKKRKKKKKEEQN